MSNLIEDIITGAFCAFVGVAAVAMFYLGGWWIGQLIQIAVGAYE